MKNEKLRKAGGLFLSFLVPVFLTIGILQANSITYGGKITLLTYDMQAQYMPFLASLRYLFTDPSKFFFNWNYSLGGNFLGVFGYYLASPLNLITLLWDVEHFADAIYVLFLVKIGFCGLTSHIWLKTRKGEKADLFSTLIFSTCYALMSYTLAYGISIMWLDAIILLPLVILGIDKMAEGKKGGLFLGALALTFISNYYMSYMVGVFAFFYLCTQLVKIYSKEKKKDCITCVIRFTYNTLLALCLSLPVVLPSVFNMSYRYQGGKSLGEFEVFYKHSVIDVIKGFLPFQYHSFHLAGAVPFFFCGSIFLVLVPLYFIEKRPLKEKLLSLLLMAVVFLGFVVQKIDFVWHGFRYPAGFPFRYAFLFSFLLIMLGQDAWVEAKFDNKYKSLALVVAGLYTFVELFLNGSVIIRNLNKDFGYEGLAEYKMSHEIYKEFSKEIKKDTGFYRKADQYALIGDNVDSIYDTHGTTFFSSPCHNVMRLFLTTMGAESDNTETRMTLRATTPVLESFLGVKYIIGFENPYGVYREKMKTTGDLKFTLYDNAYAMELGYLVGKAEEPEFMGDPFFNQFMLLDYLGVENSLIFKQLPYGVNVEEIEGGARVTLTFTTMDSENICFYIDGKVINQDMVNIYVDGNYLKTTNQTNTRGTYQVGGLAKGMEHTITLEGNFAALDQIYLCEFDTEAYENEFKALKESGRNVAFTQKGNCLEADVDLEAAGKLMLTLAYDEGYRVTIDGKKAKTETLLDTFLGIPLEEGKHHVKIVMVPKGITEGWIAAVLALLILVIIYRKKNGEKS